MSSPSDLDLELTELLYRAQASLCGIAFATSDPTRAIAHAYRLRASLADESLAELRFHRDPTSHGRVWITHHRDASST